MPLPPAIPRGQRADDSSIADTLRLYRGLDPNASWNAQVYNPTVPIRVVSMGAIRTEELSTRTDLAALRTRYQRWKFAEFTAGDARAAGYILMRDPNDPKHILLYDRNDPDRRAAKSTAQKLANVACVV